MLNKRWFFFLPIIIAIVIFILLKQNSPAPQQNPAQEMTTSVRTLPIPSLTVTPIAIGYGTVQPVSTWEAFSQVKGIIIDKHPDLAKGAIIKKGTLLLKIDPMDYELNIAQIRADILASQSQMDELDTKQENTLALLEIEKKSLILSQKEHKRLKNLLKENSVSHSDFDTQERNMLAQQQSVLIQANSLKLLPKQKALLDAQLQQKQSQLKQAQRDLNNTQIIMPFTGRISSDNVEINQYVSVGYSLAAADALDKAEIEVQIPIRYFRGLLRSDKSIDLLDNSMPKFNTSLGIKASVVLREGGLTTTWDAKFSRLSDTLDPKTRTIGVIVEVKNPYGDVKPGEKPPLVKGFFVEVHLLGNPRPKSLVVPRSALHNNQLYILNADNRLEIKKISVELFQPEFALISSIADDNSSHKIVAGDKIVISDLMPAIRGMLLSEQSDQEAIEHLTSVVTANSNITHIEQSKKPMPFVEGVQ